MTLREFQKTIEAIYFERDRARGVESNFRWLVEEIGELARALRDDDPRALAGEFADCLAWLTSLASLKGIDLETVAIEKYGRGCPRCRATPCACPPVR